MKIQLHTPNTGMKDSRKVGGKRSLHASRFTFPASAFTLVELMLVVTIIGILAALVIPKITGRSEQARITAAHADIFGGIKTALDAYEVDNGHYPRSLQDLLRQPSDAHNWHGPYLDNLPMDPWQRPYIYYYPGKHNPNSYDLLSLGNSGKEGNDDNIVNWTQ
ncbi:MAG: type II secretion system major pseudopilin GspG [Verrucomicrobiota bacterium]|jgi:general secretion pathway protein G